MQFGASTHSIWRQRVIGALLALPVHLLLWLTGYMPLSGWQLLIFPGLFFVYLLALLSKDGRGFIAWVLYVGEATALALFVQSTGGATSPYQAIAYPWMFGCGLTLLFDGMSRRMVPLLAGLTAISLLIAGWGSEGFGLFMVVNGLGILAMGAAILTFHLERHAARSDALLPTVLNRTAGIELLERWVNDSVTFHLSFIDLGEFKKINDQYGHHIGDEVLRVAAKRLRQSVRASDIVMRYGGDEFVLAIRDGSVVERLESLFVEPVATSAGAIQVHADVGNVPCVPGDSTEQLLQRADELMYQAKRARKQEQQTPIADLSLTRTLEA